MVDIRIKDLPLEASPTASEFLPIDLSSTRRATIQSVVEIGRPAASQAEAEAGVNSVKSMSPLTVKQSIASEVGVSIASSAQGLLASTALQPAAIGVTVQGYDADLAAIAGLTSAADKVPYATGAGAWALADFTSAGRAVVGAATAADQRAALALGGAATLSVGTAAGTVAAGDDSRIVGALQPASPTATGILTVGLSPYPQPKNSYTTTANFTLGSPNITVADGSGIQNGDPITAPTHVPVRALVVSGGGTNSLVMDVDATANGTSISTIFGRDRWDLTSTARANTAGFDSLFVGTAATGSSTWLKEVNAGGMDYPDVARAVILNNGGPVALIAGSRMSDSGPHWCLPFATFSYVDVNPNNHASWNAYQQSTLVAGAEGPGHINEESSVESFWPTVDTDPFNINAEGSVRNLRCDSGIGYASERGTPNDISSFIDFAFNDARARSGIVFEHNCLDISGGRIAPAIAMGPSHSLTWFGAAATETWKIYSTATTGSNSLRLLADSMRSSADIGVNKAPGVAGTLNFYQNDIPRIAMGRDTTGDLSVALFDVAGSFIGIPFRVNGANGAIRLDNLAASASFANDAAASAGGVPLNTLYRNGSVVQIRIT